MKIENFKEKLTARCEKEYHAQPKELTPEQLHCAVSGLVMEELSRRGRRAARLMTRHARQAIFQWSSW